MKWRYNGTNWDGTRWRVFREYTRTLRLGLRSLLYSKSRATNRAVAFLFISSKRYEKNRAFIRYFNEHTNHNRGEPSFFLHFYFLFCFGGLGDSQPKPNTFCSIGLWFHIGGSRYVWLWIKRTVEVDWIYIVMGTFYVWRIWYNFLMSFNAFHCCSWFES